MAIQIEFNTFIVRCETLRRKYPGGVEGYVRDLGGPGPVKRCDGRLFATGSMGADFDRDLDLLTSHGVRRFDEQGRADEIAVLNEIDDPRAICPWLDFGEAREPRLLFAFLRSEGFEANPRVAVMASWREKVERWARRPDLNYLFGYTSHHPPAPFPRWPGILAVDSVETFVNPLSSGPPNWLPERHEPEADPDESIAEMIRTLRSKGTREWHDFLESLPDGAEAKIRELERRQGMSRWEAYLAWLPPDAREKIREVEAKYDTSSSRPVRSNTIRRAAPDRDDLDSPVAGARRAPSRPGALLVGATPVRPLRRLRRLVHHFQRYETFIWHDDAGLWDPPILVKVRCRRSDGYITEWGIEWTDTERRLYAALTGEARDVTPEDHS